MPKSKEKNKLSDEIAKIDAQMVALAKLKQKHLNKISAATSPENQMSREEWEDRLVDVFAEAIVYLGQHGMLPLKDDPVPATDGSSLKEKTPNCKKKKRAWESLLLGVVCRQSGGGQKRTPNEAAEKPRQFLLLWVVSSGTFWIPFNFAGFKKGRFK